MEKKAFECALDMFKWKGCMPLDGTQKQLGSKMRPSSSIRAFQFNSLDSVLSRIYLVKRINSQLSLKNVLLVA